MSTGDVSPPAGASGGPKLQAIQAVETNESVTGRLAAATDAQKRSRLVLVIMGIACAALIVATYNAYLSFDRSFALSVSAENPDDLSKTRPDGTFADVPMRRFKSDDRTGPSVLNEHALRSWADNRMVSISLLGIRVSVDDAPILGTVALFVISIWFLLSVRRENNVIVYLLRDTRRDGRDITVELLRRQWRIFHGIVSESVFTMFEKSLVPVGGLGRKKANVGKVGRWGNRCLSFFLYLIAYFVFLLPVLTSVFVFGLDWWAYSQRSAFREGLGAPPLENVRFFQQEAFWMFLIFFLLLSLTTVLSLWYNAHTERTIRRYYSELEAGLKVLPAAPEVPL